MVTLRTDLRQWLIYDDESAYATADALDALAYRFTGAALSQHEDIELRAVGSFMLKVAEVREKQLSGEDRDPRRGVRHRLEGQLVRDSLNQRHGRSGPWRREG